MKSSGEAGMDTAGDGAITLLDCSQGTDLVAREVNVVNTGAVDGLVSIDNGRTWCYMPAAVGGAPGSRTFDLRAAPYVPVVQAKRFAGGSNMTGLFADAM